MTSIETRVQLMEQKIIVMQKEINAVLTDISGAMEGLAKGNRTLLHAMAARMDEIEKQLGIGNVESAPIRTDESGKEI